MKKIYINIKTFMQSHVKNVQLAAVAVLGLGITVFCSAYTLPEGCTASITLDGPITSDCGTYYAMAECTGDDKNDTVTAKCNGGSGLNLNFYSDSQEACDSTSWGNRSVPFQTISLITGLNKITATESENGLSSEVDITSNGANQPNIAITSAWSSSIPGVYPCGLLILFSLNCFTPKEIYYLGENVTPDGSCPSCSNIPNYGNTTTDNTGSGGIWDSSQVPCPSPKAQNCSCTETQQWHVDDLGPHNPQQNNIVTGTTIRQKHTAPNVSTVTLTSS